MMEETARRNNHSNLIQIISPYFKCFSAMFMSPPTLFNIYKRLNGSKISHMIMVVILIIPYIAIILSSLYNIKFNYLT